MPALPAGGSPVLVGRDEAVDAAVRRFEAAVDGAGGLLFVAGEAGIGKTRLLGELAARARALDVAVLPAAAFPGDAQSSAGLLLDLAGGLAATGDAATSALGRSLAARLRAAADLAPHDGTPHGDAHHRRRVLVQDLVDQLVDQLARDRPALVLLEDLHWADELSLDVVAHLAGRLPAAPVLVAGAYRSDELYPHVPMRQLRTRLLGQRLAAEIRLPRLSREHTAELTAALLGHAAPDRLVAALHDRSDGIPLHVEELLAAVPAETTALPWAPDTLRATAVPDTLADAVRDRAGRLGPQARAVAAAAAVIGRSFDVDLLTAVTGQDADAVAAALRTLREAHLVVPGRDPVSVDFRHALIRDALYADTDLPLRRRLHGRVAAAGAARGGDAFVSLHWEQAGRGDLAHRHALAAAREAAALSAHGEALELYRRALRHLPATAPAAERATLHAALGDEAAAVDENAAAAAAYRTAHDLFTAAGDVRRAAGLVPRMVEVAHLLGSGFATRAATLRAAVATLDGVPGCDREHARLLAGLADAYMLDRNLDEAAELGAVSLACSRRIGDHEAAVHTAATLGSVLVFAGRTADGWAMLDDALADARQARREAEAARTYRMLATSASVVVEYDRAERRLTEGIDYAAGVELWNHRHYMAAHLAHVHWATGRWDQATRLAESALADGRGGITTRITARYVLGYLALGRGAWDAASSLLAEALADGEAMAELQRVSPALWGLAELARCRGDAETAVRLCERGRELSAGLADSAYLFPYLLTGVRAHLARGANAEAGEWADRVGRVLAGRGIPGTLPAIGHARGLLLLAAGDPRAAAVRLAEAEAAWRASRRFWEGSWARLDLAAAAVRARRRGEGHRLLAQVRAEASAAGAQVLLDAADGLDAGPSAGPVPWHPLSSREFEVARLVADGLTNRQIAERLTVAPKTVSAHVEHILTKLGAARRTQIAAWCAALAGRQAGSGAAVSSSQTVLPPPSGPGVTPQVSARVSTTTRPRPDGSSAAGRRGRTYRSESS